MCDYIEMDSILGMFDDLEIDIDDDWDETDPPIDILEGEDEYVEL